MVNHSWKKFCLRLFLHNSSCQVASDLFYLAIKSVMLRSKWFNLAEIEEKVFFPLIGDKLATSILKHLFIFANNVAFW